LAAAAYLRLLAIERGDDEEIRATLSETLLGPLESWRRFELLVALAMGESLSRAIGAPWEISTSFAGGGPLLRAGRYELHWQSRTEHYQVPVPEASEIKVNQILTALGVGTGWDRPDVVVVDSETHQVVALAEAKYWAGTADDGRGVTRAAVEQLVRYARGYRSEHEWDGLLGHSLAVPVSMEIGCPDPKPVGVPWVFDLRSIQDQQLDHWSRALIAASATSAEPTQRVA